MVRKVLVVGGGGREHAICRALYGASSRPAILVAPGNAGTTDLGKNVAIPANDVEALTAFAKREQVDLVIVGPELPLVLGLGDKLRDAGIPCCGPGAAAARLEGSKIFMREVAEAAGVPSPRWLSTRREAELGWAVDSWEGLPVIKADGLASGKGVFLPDDKQGCVAAGRDLLRGSLGAAGKEIVLEERLTGVEASLFYACAGDVVVRLPNARDHKRLRDGEQGPNTGGMGAVSPNPSITKELEDEVQKTIVEPVLRELVRRGAPFSGFLFAGLMLTGEGPKLLEFNVRLGDPETQAIVPRLSPDAFLELCERTAAQSLVGFELTPEAGATCAVVLACAGYPEQVRSGDGIYVTEGLEGPDRWLIHAGTALNDKGKLVTAGGRVAAVVARGKEPDEARQKAYVGVRHVTFEGMQYRNDIGAPGRRT